MADTDCGCSGSILTPCTKTKNLSSNFAYNGPSLPCIGVEPCDNLNVVFQKINSHICSLDTQTTANGLEIEQLNIILNNIEAEILILTQQLQACCPQATTTTTSTSTVKPPCQSWNWEHFTETGRNDVDLIYENCEGTIITIDKLIINNNAGSICVAPGTTPYWSAPSSIGFHQISYNNITCGV